MKIIKKFLFLTIAILLTSCETSNPEPEDNYLEDIVIYIGTGSWTEYNIDGSVSEEFEDMDVTVTSDPFYHIEGGFFNIKVKFQKSSISKSLSFHLDMNSRQVTTNTYSGYCNLSNYQSSGGITINTDYGDGPIPLSEGTWSCSKY